MMYSTSRFFTAALLAALLAAGCGGGDVKQTTTTTTMGQELMDLDASHKQGILSDKEYREAKQRIMDRY